MGVPPVRKKAVKRRLSQLYRSVLQGLCLPSGQFSDFFSPHLTYPETLPWVCTYPSAKMNLKVTSSGRSKTHMSWHYPLTFDPQGAFVRICSVSLVPKEVGSGDPLILYSNRVLPLFVLTMANTLKCLQETNTGYLPCFFYYFHFRGQKGACL